jgi:hypothetical protein
VRVRFMHRNSSLGLVLYIRVSNAFTSRHFFSSELGATAL